MHNSNTLSGARPNPLHGQQHYREHMAFGYRSFHRERVSVRQNASHKGREKSDAKGQPRELVQAVNKAFDNLPWTHLDSSVGRFAYSTRAHSRSRVERVLVHFIEPDKILVTGKCKSFLKTVMKKSNRINVARFIDELESITGDTTNRVPFEGGKINSSGYPANPQLRHVIPVAWHLALEFDNKDYRIFHVAVAQHEHGWKELMFPHKVKNLKFNAKGVRWAAGHRLSAKYLYFASRPAPPEELLNETIGIGFKNRAPATKDNQYHTYIFRLAPFNSRPFVIQESVSDRPTRQADKNTTTSPSFAAGTVGNSTSKWPAATGPSP